VWAAIGRDMVEWDKAVMVCAATLGPWMGLAEMLSGKASTANLSDLHPYRRIVAETSAKTADDGDAIGWKEFLGAAKNRKRR